MDSQAPFDAVALQRLGWKPFFQTQMSLDEFEHLVPARVAELQRSQLLAFTGSDTVRVEFSGHERWSESVTVGDWVLARREGTQLYLARVLERDTGIARKAAGNAVGMQWLSANLDTVFIAMACDLQFSINRLERYLAVVVESRITPLVVLTKADLVADSQALLAQIPNGVQAMALDTRDADQLGQLMPYLGIGQTVAVIGMSGAGKSTLVNTILGTQAQRTSSVRDADGHGRHTTTSRHLLELPSGGWIIDTPGMRELQLAGTEESVALVFPDVDALARSCKFSDCEHESEPGCKIRDALARGELDDRRWQSYRKLQREQAFAERQFTAHHVLVQQRRNFTKQVKRHVRAKKQLRDTSFDKDE